MLKNCDSELPEAFCYFGNVCGFLSSLIWFIVLFPQIVLNYKRKSVKGISNLWASMNFFASLINIIFIYSIQNMPIFSRISAVYMPILEYIFLLQIFYYHDAHKNVRRCYFLLLNLAILILCGVLIYLVINVENSLSYIEWGAIVLWSFESFPQIHLNFSLSNASALSKIGQLITFIGKTADILSNYLLIIPYQYRFLGFFSTTNAYLCMIQVLYYFQRDNHIKDIHKMPLQQTKTEGSQFEKLIKVVSFGMCIVVFICCGGTAFGFLARVGNFWISVPILIVEYVFVVVIYLFVRLRKSGNPKGEQFMAITEEK